MLILCLLKLSLCDIVVFLSLMKFNIQCAFGFILKIRCDMLTREHLEMLVIGHEAVRILRAPFTYRMRGERGKLRPTVRVCQVCHDIHCSTP